jgi:hypothetical protein
VGFLIAFAFDAFDVVLVTLLGDWGSLDYHSIDKLLDTYILFFLVYNMWHWKNLKARKTGLILFAWRMIGFLLFEVTKIRPLLVIFPNMVQIFYVGHLVQQKYFKKDRLTTWKAIFILLVILFVPKMIQEFGLHYFQLQPWTFTQELLGLN